jgi:hypothetical protein
LKIAGGLVPRIPYSVWFLDERADVDDQHREWVAGFEVEAESEELAKLWGDKLAEIYASRREQLRVVNSQTEPAGSWDQSDRTHIPTIPYGHLASDDEIGW